MQSFSADKAAAPAGICPQRPQKRNHTEYSCKPGYVRCKCTAVVICLDLPSPAGSSDLPGQCGSIRSAGGPPVCPVRSCFGWGLHGSGCYQPDGSLLHCLSTLTSELAVYFCCTFLGVTPTGRYPASCPVKPGLSSPGIASGRDHPPYSGGRILT